MNVMTLLVDFGDDSPLVSPKTIVSIDGVHGRLVKASWEDEFAENESMEETIREMEEQLG